MANKDRGSLSLLQKIEGIREIADVLEKDKQGYGYTYTSESEILLKVRAGMSKYGVTIFPNFVQDSIKIEPRYFCKKKWNKETKQFEDGDQQAEYLISAWINMRIINTDNAADYIEVPWFMTASASDPAQAMGSALTYANRYFFLKFLNIATSEDDPDAWRKRNEEAKNAEEAAAVSKVLDSIGALISQYLSQDQRSKFAAMLQEHIMDGGKPSADYRSIKTLDKANEVYVAVRKFFKLDETAKEE